MSSGHKKNRNDGMIFKKIGGWRQGLLAVIGGKVASELPESLLLENKSVIFLSDKWLCFPLFLMHLSLEMFRKNDF